MPERRRKPRPFSTHFATVAASFRHGMRMVSSVIGASLFAPEPQKKRYPGGYLFEAKTALLAAAGAGQVFRRHSGAVGGVVTAAPAEDALGSAAVRRCGGRARQRHEGHE